MSPMKITNQVRAFVIDNADASLADLAAAFPQVSKSTLSTLRSDTKAVVALITEMPERILARVKAQVQAQTEVTAAVQDARDADAAKRAKKAAQARARRAAKKAGA